jgi:hypothetical protein
VTTEEVALERLWQHYNVWETTRSYDKLLESRAERDIMRKEGWS